MTYNLNPSNLTDLLREAAAAHHNYERVLGTKHEDWAPWYAAWILNALNTPTEGAGVACPGEPDERARLDKYLADKAAASYGTDFPDLGSFDHTETGPRAVIETERKRFIISDSL